MATLTNLYAICEAVQELLANDPSVLERVPVGQIEHNEQVNGDPDRMPWIGIYPSRRSGNSMRPHTLGSNGWLDEARIDLVLQTINLDSTNGRRAQEEMQAVIQVVVQTIITAKTLGSSLARVVSIDVDYVYFQPEGANVFYPEAIMTVGLEVRQR